MKVTGNRLSVLFVALVLALGVALGAFGGTGCDTCLDTGESCEAHEDCCSESCSAYDEGIYLCD